MKQINNLEELRMAQVELQHRISMKELELKAHANSIRELLNPMTYINLAISRISYVEKLVTAFYNGYTTFKEMIARYSNRKSAQTQTEATDNIPDNNQ